MGSPNAADTVADGVCVRVPVGVRVALKLVPHDGDGLMLAVTVCDADGDGSVYAAAL